MNTTVVEPTPLCHFEPHLESLEEQSKRSRIEDALKDEKSTLITWQLFATSCCGLINDDLRRSIWPRLLGLNHNICDDAPDLNMLKHHPEYNQVILDVNRSLKRFPPGIPYEQRIALQDKLTVLILRVITKHPHLRYYQGYHDVAVTFLLVVGDEMAYHVMEYLSTHHLLECMQETMEPTQRRLMLMYPIIRHANPELFNHIYRSGVGTLFALPWYLTWFGHSLKSYRHVVRLYDYFLSRPFLLPIYVTAAIILYREHDIFSEECDMASMHCILSKLPDDLPFEYIIQRADELYGKWPPTVIEPEVAVMIDEEHDQRKRDEEAMLLRKTIKRKGVLSVHNAHHSIFQRITSFAMLKRPTLYVTTAFSLFVGLYAYYYKAHLITSR